MTRATFRSTLDAAWLALDPVRVGDVAKGAGTADRFVTVGSEDGTPLRVDLFRHSGECCVFEEVCLWAGFAAIGWGERLFLVELATREALTFDLGFYFGHLYPEEGYLLVASGERLFRFEPDGSPRWRSDCLGIDGVLVHGVEGDVVRGEGEWDPPGGWRPFSVSLHSGQALA